MVSLCAVASFAMGTTAHAQSYTSYNITTLSSVTASTGYAINDNGQIAGQFVAQSKIHAYRRDTTLQNPGIGTLVDLGTLYSGMPQPNQGVSSGFGISTSGQVVGTACIYPSTYASASFCTLPNSAIRGGNQPPDPDCTATRTFSYAIGINSSGYSVGYALPDGATYHTFAPPTAPYPTSATSPYYNPQYAYSPGNGFNAAYAVNNAGLAVGVAINTADNKEEAFRWNPIGTPVVPPTWLSPGVASAAYGINNTLNPMIVGQANGVACFWQNGVCTPLVDTTNPAVPITVTGVAYGVNNNGVIVGQYKSPTNVLSAFVFKYNTVNGAQVGKLTLLTGGVATAINSNGWIVVNSDPTTGFANYGTLGSTPTTPQNCVTYLYVPNP